MYHSHAYIAEKEKGHFHQISHCSFPPTCHPCKSIPRECRYEQRNHTSRGHSQLTSTRQIDGKTECIMLVCNLTEPSKRELAKQQEKRTAKQIFQPMKAGRLPLCRRRKGGQNQKIRKNQQRNSCVSSKSKMGGSCGFVQKRWVTAKQAKSRENGKQWATCAKGGINVSSSQHRRRENHQ